MDIRDLTKTTFIIPIKIEHKDRYRNAEMTLNFLNKHEYNFKHDANQTHREKKKKKNI